MYQAIIFDYGNTLIEFAAAQLQRCDKILADALVNMFGPMDIQEMRAIRDRDRRSPYTGQFRENDVPAITAAMIRQLYGRDATPEQIAHLVEVRFQSFIDSIEAPEYVGDFLADLKQRYKLGLLSNYPCGKSVRTSLERTELLEYFDAVVVSADVGHVKPHPLPFRTVLDQLGVEAADALYVGDNWLGDVQGAKRIGMHCAFVTQFDTPEKFDREPDHVDPDYTIEHLTDLKQHV
jgi:HAD superfamily hydrolase (TIGR01549 family)